MKSMNTTSVIALFLIFLGAVGGIMMYFGQQQSSAADKADIIKTTKDENLALKTQLSELKDERLKLKHELEVRDRKVTDQNQAIVNLNNKLVEKSDYITNFLTGAEGFPTIKFSSIKSESPDKDELVMFHLDSESKWPIYDIVARLYNYNKILEKQIIKPNDPVIYIKRSDFDASMMVPFDENSLSPNSNVIGSTKYSMINGLVYVQIKSRSSFVFQKIAFVTEGRINYSGSQIHDSNGKVLLERFDPNASESIKRKIRDRWKLIPDKVGFSFING